MTDDRTKLGQHGEQIVASMLEARGWQVLHRNVRLSCGELDLIGRDGDTLVFVEVKTLRLGGAQAESAPERAVLAVDERKQSRIRRLAAEWLALGNTPRGISEFRFDVIGVEFDRLRPDRRPSIDHIESAF
jgi:putative endonuclease